VTRKRKQRIVEQRDREQSIVVPGSDQRATGGVQGDCRLCGTFSQLLLGHVAPRWMLKWAKAEGGLLGDYNSLGVRVLEQDGLKLYLLCRACEELLGHAERYASLFMAGDADSWTSLGVYTHLDAILGVDHALLQRFLFGVILKAHWAQEPPYHNVSLRPDDEAQLKKHVLTGSSAEEDYPILCMRMHSTVKPAIDPRAFLIVGVHYDGELPGSYVIGAGWELGFFFNRDRFLNATEFYNLRMRFGRPLWIGILDITEHRLITRGHFHSW
jgi:hypothetical protein